MEKTRYILFAEDDEDDQELIKMAIERLPGHHTYQIVSNGQQVLDLLKQNPNLPCVIILDLNMPILNGLQTLEELQRQPEFSKVPKVIFSTSDNDENKRMSFLHGAIDYHVKPASMKGFVSAVEKLISYCR